MSLADDARSEGIDRLLASEQAKVADARRERDAAKQALKDQAAIIAELESRLSLVEGVSALSPSPPKWLTPKKARSGNRATVTTILSDSHFDEVVNPDEVGGTNAYDRRIATLRLRRYFERVVRISRDLFSGVTYDGCVLMLGGDLFSGDIHDELSQTNEPGETILSGILYWSELVAAGIDMLADEFGKVHVPAVVGNHGRRSRKPRAKMRAKDNFDWLFAHVVAREFAADDRVTFDIPEEADCRFSIYDTDYLLTHGDQFRGGNGIAGIWCLTPDTPILCDDLHYRPLADLEIGQSIIGFDEEPEPGTRQKFRPATITANDRAILPCVEVETTDGTVTASTEHLWLVRGSSGRPLWRRTADLRLGDDIMSMGPAWYPEDTADAGYLGGILDGEGNVEKDGGHRLSFAQRRNACLDRALDILDRWGVPYSAREGHGQNGDVVQVRLTTLRQDSGATTRQNLRVLGRTRPERLVAKSRKMWNGRGIQIAGNATVLGLRFVGDREVVCVGTSTKTLIANGLLSHNSPIMKGDAKKRSREAAADRPYDVMVMGHWHQLKWGGQFIVNGSSKGTDEYAWVSNFDPEAPAQGMWLTTPEHGASILSPIYVADRKVEGW